MYFSNKSWKLHDIIYLVFYLHPEVYILIIPGFGVISTTISASSNKSVFGQDGPLKIKWLLYLTQQTICRKLVAYILQTTLLRTLCVNYKLITKSIKINLINVTMFVQGIFLFQTNNPPITKTLSLLIENKINSKSKTSMSNGLSMWVGISEAIRLFSTSNTEKKPNNELKEKKLNEWLAGVIDGNGCFQLSKKGYASLEITMEMRDKHCLYLIKQRFGGSVKIKSSVNWLRYRLHHKKGILSLINAVNGLIRNPVRLIQMGKLCEKYGINLKYPEPLTHDNAWLSGFFDSDGSIYLNLLSSQVFITASHKNKFLLDSIVYLYGGTIYPMVKVGAFKWTVFRKDEIAKLLAYFKVNPSRSAKHKRLKLLVNYSELKNLKAHIASSNSLLGKNWKIFIKKWENYK